MALSAESPLGAHHGEQECLPLNLAIFPARPTPAARQPGGSTEPEGSPAMNQLNLYLARHEIDRRLRAVDHHRRIRWGRESSTATTHTYLAGFAQR